MQRQIVTVEQFYKEHAAALQMRLLAGERGLKRIIREATVNRPGLVLGGFTHYFAYKRVQVFGNAEVYYLRSLTPAQRSKRYAHFSPLKSRALFSAAISARTKNLWPVPRRRACRFFNARWSR